MYNTLFSEEQIRKAHDATVMKEGIISTAINMIKDKMDPTLISKYTGLSYSEIQALYS